MFGEDQETIVTPEEETPKEETPTETISEQTAEESKTEEPEAGSEAEEPNEAV